MTYIPKKISAGVDFKLSLTFDKYKPNDYDLKLFLRGPKSISLVAKKVLNDHFRFDVISNVTALWLPGYYSYSLIAENKLGNKYKIEASNTTIHADIASLPDGYDARSHKRKVLDAIEAVIEGRATKEQQSYSINNRSLSFIPLAELYNIRNKYKAELALEASNELIKVHRIRFSD